MGAPVQVKRLTHRLPLEIDHFRHQLVRRGDDPGVRLEPSLGRDHVDELLGEVDVAELEGVGGDVPEPRGAGGADDRLAGVGRFPVEVPPELHELGGGDELGQRDLADEARLPVREDARHLAVIGDGEALEGPRRVAVLVDGQHRELGRVLHRSRVLEGDGLRARHAGPEREDGVGDRAGGRVQAPGRVEDQRRRAVRGLDQRPGGRRVLVHVMDVPLVDVGLGVVDGDLVAAALRVVHRERRGRVVVLRGAGADVERGRLDIVGGVEVHGDGGVGGDVRGALRGDQLEVAGRAGEVARRVGEVPLEPQVGWRSRCSRPGRWRNCRRACSRSRRCR